MKIYRNAVEIYDLTVDSSSKLTQKLMGEDLVTVSVTVDAILDIRLGDYILFKGQKYEVNRPVDVKKSSAVEYAYTIQFEGMFYRLLDKMVMLNGDTDFYLTGTLEDFIDLLIANINTIDPEADWVKGDVYATDWKNIYIDTINCKELLDLLVEKFAVEFSVVGKVINAVERVEDATALSFQVGKELGLYELSRESVDNENTVTRAYFFGSARNLDYNYRNGKNRLIFVTAEGKSYLENTSEYGKIVEKNVIFEDIYPRFTGTVSAVSSDGMLITSTDLDFDLNDYLISGVTAKVVFLSGDLMGVQCEISSFDSDLQQFKIIATSETNGISYPNSSFKPAVTDKFTFVDITMPPVYVNDAENLLLSLGQKWLDYYSQLRVSYKLTLDYRYIRDNAIVLNIGDVVNVNDAALGINKSIRIVALTENVDGSGITAEISNYREEKWQKALTSALSDTIEELTAARDAATSAGQSITNINQYLESYTPTFDKITGLPTDNAALKDYLDQIGGGSVVDTSSRIVSGTVLWFEGLKYKSTLFNYLIYGIPYTAIARDGLALPALECEAADPNLPRVDVVYLDTFSNINIRTGVAAVNPVAPTLAANELFVTYIYIAAGALEPTDVNIEKVYDEGATDGSEWEATVFTDAGKTGLTVTATDDPLVGVKHLKMTVAVPDETLVYPAHYVGEPYQGGRIFWIDPASGGKKGMIAALADIASDAAWSRLSDFSVYATNGRSRAMYAGLTNSNLMLATPAAAGQAIKLIDEYTADGYNDWLMGSWEEMGVLRTRSNSIGGFDASGSYWTSTEHDWNQAVCLGWGNGKYSADKKNGGRRIRPIRYFDDTGLPASAAVESYAPADTSVVFSAGGEFPIGDAIVSFNMKHANAFRTNSILLIELYLGAVRVGSCALSPVTSLFGFKPELDDWQLVAIGIAQFVPTKTVIDAIKVSFTGSWNNNATVYIDDMRFQYTDVVNSGKTIQQVPELVLNQEDWSFVNGVWQYQLFNSKIADNSIVDVIPLNEDADIINAAGILPETISSEGFVLIFSTNQPTADIHITITIMEASV